MFTLLLLQIPLFPSGPGSGGKIQGRGPLGLEGAGSDTAPTKFETALSTAVGVLTVVAGIYFLITLLIGAIGWISAGGDKTKLEEAQGKIRNGLVGLIITIAAVFMANLIGFILGFDIILNPTAIIP